MTYDPDDPWNDTPCVWPACKATGNPYTDQGWGWWWRYYLWLPEGFCCPEHTAFIEAEKEKDPASSFFRDCPRDMSPEVLAFRRDVLELDSDDGQRIVREVEAVANRAAFRLVAFRLVDGKDDAES